MGYTGRLASVEGRPRSATKGAATRRPQSLTSGRYFEAELERPVCRQVVASPCNHQSRSRGSYQTLQRPEAVRKHALHPITHTINPRVALPSLLPPCGAIRTLPHVQFVAFAQRSLKKVAGPVCRICRFSSIAPLGEALYPQSSPLPSSRNGAWSRSSRYFVGPPLASLLARRLASNCLKPSALALTLSSRQKSRKRRS